MFTYDYFKWGQNSTCAWAAALFRFLDHARRHTWYDFSERRVSKTITNDEHPCTQRDSIPRSQKARDVRPTPQTSRPPGSAVPLLHIPKQELCTALSRLNATECVGRLCSLHSSRCVPSARLSYSFTESSLVAAFGPKPNLFLAQSKRDLTQNVRVSLVEGTVRWFGIAVELYVFFWVFPRRQIVICRRFGPLCQFHLQGLVVEY
jgi:hypothetical protein